jgi:hypothetical protein
MMVLTSHDELGNTGCNTGFWLAEFAAQIVLASPKGGELPSIRRATSQTVSTVRVGGIRTPRYSALRCCPDAPAQHGREPIDAGPSALINH